MSRKGDRKATGGGNAGAPEVGAVRRDSASARTGPNPRRSFSWRRLTVLILAAVAVALAATWYLTPPEATPPPALSEVDVSRLPYSVRVALDRAQREVVESPLSGDAWGQLAMTFYAHDFLPQALDCFAEAARLSPNDPRWPYLRGMIRAESDPAMGLDEIELAARIAGDQPEIETRLGELLLALGRIEESETRFRKAALKTPDQPRIQLGLARIAFQRGEWDECLRLVQAASERVPDRRDALELLARVHQRLGHGGEAAEAMNRAAALPEASPWSDSILAEAIALRSDAYFLVDQADLLFQQGKLLEHLRVLDQLVQETPDDATSAVRLARGLLYARDPVTAAKVLDDTLVRHPGAVEPTFLRAVVHFNRGEIDQAILRLREAIVAKPDYVEAHYQLAACYRQTGEDTLAMGELETVLRLEPAFVPARLDFAEMLLIAGKKQTARAEIEAALKLDAQNERAQKLLTATSKE